jgi:hypothetical protein
LIVCRLSIIVPYDRDEAAFETTLVSVLENRPEFCEVLVVHDGTYTDPFELEDEVRFVIAPHSDRLALLRAGVRESLGRIVHILGEGARATEDWSEQPLELFESSDVGSVSPVLRDLSAGGTVVAAGWRDSRHGLRRAVAAGSRSPSRRQCAAVDGAYLSGSFWRRATLDRLLELPIGHAQEVADYVWAATARRAGWKCRVACDSTVVCSPRLIHQTESPLAAGSLLQQVRGGSRRRTLLSTGLSCALQLSGAPLSGSNWGEACGRLLAACGLTNEHRELVRQMQSLAREIGPDAARATILRIPGEPGVASAAGSRRAA